MANHKAPTDVTLASTREESDLQQLVQRYWPTAAGIALAGSAAIVFMQWRDQEASSASLGSWERLGEESPMTQGLTPPAPAIMAELADELADTPAGPWAKAIEIGKRVSDEDADGARRALGELNNLWGDHLLATQDLYPRPEGSEGPPRRLADHVDAQLTALAAWEAENPGLTRNPALPEGAPRVKIETTLGSIVVGLYDDLAPEHAANFIKLAQEGFYDGVKFHRVLLDAMVQAGDPNSREAGNEATWGQGGPGYTLEPEIAGLWHFPGALAAAATSPGGPTSGSQFYIVTGDDQHQKDGDYTVFGTLLEGQAVVDQIEAGAVLGERPQEPVEILSTEVL